jgi:hypothetical protein
MRQRCSNPNTDRYEHYGGRGIAICERWQSFEDFYADMGPRPSPKHSIDRIDVDGDYEPGNCRWATPAEQARNKRSNLMLTHDGRTQTITEWARETRIPLMTISRRLKSGWPVDRALSPVVR